MIKPENYRVRYFVVERIAVLYNWQAAYNTASKLGSLSALRPTLRSLYTMDGTRSGTKVTVRCAISVCRHQRHQSTCRLSLRFHALRWSLQVQLYGYCSLCSIYAGAPCVDTSHAIHPTERRQRFAPTGSTYYSWSKIPCSLRSPFSSNKQMNSSPSASVNCATSAC